MPLTSGDRFGAYEIISPLGVGGMGEVYRAADSRLKRHVAIKVLPEAFASDPERLARFQREAETLAALNHPNIAAIYGIEDAAGVSGLVMALVDGPTLADVIAEGPLAIDDALNIARQIAAAIEAAHEQGIVHRDLKPANIKVVDGAVKVLDFGLAKNIAPLSTQASDHSPTITSPAMTMMGVVLGTAAYMSPEQGRGRAVDKRADIWAFGVVLYEMLTGSRPFDGEDVSLTLAAVMTAEPDLSRLPRGVPPSVRACLVQCLKKDVRLRLRDIGDARLFIDGAFVVADRVDAPRATGRPRVMRIALALTALAAVALLGTGAGWALRPLPSLPVTRFDYQLADNLGPGNRPNVAVSRDGQRLVYGTVRGLFVHHFNSGQDRLVAAFDNSLPTVHPTSPSFSPDGAFVSFFTEGQLKRVAVDGGTAASLCAATEAIGGDWALDGYIYFASREGISRVASEGGTAEVVAQRVEGEQLTTPQLLPDRQTLLFTAFEMGKASESFISNRGGSTLQPSKVIAQRISNGERHVIVPNGANARYVASGHILYTVGTALFGQRFNPNTLRVEGTPVALLDGIRIGTSASGVGVAHYAVSDDGSLFYLRPTDTSVPAVWVDRSGKPETITTLPPMLFASPRLSSDGRKLLTVTQNDVRIFDLETGRESPVTIDRTAGTYASWSPDETRVVYSSTRAGTAGPMNLWMQALDGSAARQISTLDGLVHIDAWSPDGKWILAHRHPPRGTGYSLMRFPVDGDRIGEPQDFTSPPGTQEAASFSPDGVFVAYVDTVSGRPEVVIRPFQHPGQVVPVSVGGGREPYWTKGGELFYRRYSDDAMMVVKVSTTPTLRVGASQQLFAGPGAQGGSSRSSYAVTADGQRFIMGANRVIGETSKLPSISVVLNWINELKARIP